MRGHDGAARGISCMSDPSPTTRLDKWLWAARFFRTRTLAQQAIETGRVRCDGERVKPSRHVGAGALLVIRVGFEEFEVRILGVAEKRGSAPLARLLYAETETGRERRETAALQRRAAAIDSPERPSKKDRRLIHRFKRSLGDV